MPKLGKYFSFFQLSASHTLKNYKALIGLSIFLVTCLLIFAHLWKIAAAKIGGVATFTPEELLWYIAFNEWVLISIPDIQSDMEHDLRSGKLAYLLPRPVSYLGATFAEAMGTLCVNLFVLGVVAFLFTWLRVESFPFHGAGFAVMAVMGILAGCVGVLFQMMIGLSAFWLHEVEPISWIWEKFLFMLGGLILPLTVYPQWMQTIAKYTPFPVILGDRSALAIDFTLTNILSVTFSLLSWLAIGFLIISVLYRRGMRILNIGGG